MILLKKKQKQFLEYCEQDIITNEEREMIERILSDGWYTTRDKDMLNVLRYIFLAFFHDDTNDDETE
jgi:hypothetical protein